MYAYKLFLNKANIKIYINKMKYIRSFETLAGFQAAEAILDRPNVSLIEATMGLNYLPYVAPVVPQHDYVEIGGIKWATMNVGANSITDYGLYFQWGDTQGYTASQVGSGEGKKYFGWADYKYGDGSDGEMYTPQLSKYNSTDGKTVLDSSDDAAIAAWGGNWRTPTHEEWVAFSEAVDAVWTTDYQGSGVNGFLCTDKTDSSKVIFLPAAGNAYNGVVNRANNRLHYWSSSLYSGSSWAYLLTRDSSFYSGDPQWSAKTDCRDGSCIRAILDE